MWSSSESRAARALIILIGANATVLLVIALQIVGRAGHTNVVPVAPHDPPDNALKHSSSSNRVDA